MGSTYSNVMVLGSDHGSILAALAGVEALVSPTEAGFTTVFAVQDEGEGAAQGRTAAHLATALGCPTLDCFVLDDEVLQVQAFAAGGQLAARAWGPPGGRDQMAEQVVVGDHEPADPSAAGAAVVAALGRGHGAAVQAALDDVGIPTALDRNYAVLVALVMPTDAAGWGHSALLEEEWGYTGGELTPT
jgi:hypothetical protein